MTKKSETAVYGIEPAWNRSFDTEFDKEMALDKALNWYNNMASDNDRQVWLLEYMKSKNWNSDEYDIIKNMNSKDVIIRYGDAPDIIGFDIGVAARLFMIQAPMKPEYYERIDTLIPYIIRKATSNSRKAPVRSVQDSLSENASELIAEIEEIVDEVLLEQIPNSKKSDFVEELELPEIRSSLAPRVKAHFSNVINELNNAISGSDPEVKESYSLYGKTNLLCVKEMLEKIVETCNEEIDVAKAVRASKPRKKRSKPVTEIVKKLQYKPVDKEFGLSSVLPTSIVGADKLAVFNTKYRTFSLYEANSAQGLSVKGTTLQHFDEKKSRTKIIRKPAEFFAKIKGKGIRVVKSTLDELSTTDKEATGRINEDCILYAIY